MKIAVIEDHTLMRDLLVKACRQVIADSDARFKRYARQASQARIADSERISPISQPYMRLREFASC